MNTLIEIAKQAGLKARSESELSPQELRFAQLLIKECARIDSEANNVDHEDGVTFNQTILEHFGIDSD